MDNPRALRSTVLSSVQNHPLSQRESDDSQSDLSSALSDPGGFMDLEGVTEDILGHCSNTSQPGDTTCLVLEAFQSKLRNRGKQALMTDIKTIGRDKPKLDSFARYLSDTILKPTAQFIHDFAANIQSSNRSRQSTLKEDILKRDGFRCAFSRVYDTDSAEKNLVRPHAGATIDDTQLAHILPVGLSKFNDQDKRETEAVASIWYALYRYFPELKGKIGPDTLNQHANLITFKNNVHRGFDRHKLAFCPRHRQVRVSHPCSFFPLPLGFSNLYLTSNG
ncbi:hypothetical protein LZ30DRAFT_601981 [Colletotrichum cereale]|nr:hypothetical protein LZ30DRAFT_601981 [Colletotrichum cereale]